MASPSAIPAATAPLVELDRIVPDPEQPRKHFPEGPLQELADSLWSQGLTQPITVTPGPEGGPDVIFVGERRFRAFARNRERALRLLTENTELPDDHPARWYQGWTVIPALHHPPMPSDVRLIRQVAENDDRDGLTLYERALAIHKARQLSGRSGKDFAQAHGLDPTVVSNYKILVNSKGSTKAALEQGLLRGIEAARLFMRIPADLQEALVNDATEKESVLTRPMLAKVLEDLERAQDLEKKARPASPPATPRTSKAAAAVPPDAPALTLGNLLWLEERLRPGSTGDPEPQQLAAHAALRQALVQSSAFIVILEIPEGECNLPPVDQPFVQEP